MLQDHLNATCAQKVISKTKRGVNYVCGAVLVDTSIWEDLLIVLIVLVVNLGARIVLMKHFIQLHTTLYKMKSVDALIFQLKMMTEHQYLDPVQNTWFFVVVQPRRWPKKSQIALTKKF